MEAILVSDATEGMPRISPDGLWLAYISNETGRNEVYLRPISGTGPIQVSRDGGSSPVWARDGRELYYRRGAELIAVEIQTSPELRLLEEQVLFEVNDVKAVDVEYDVGPDGRFLMVIDELSSTASSLNLVLNWAEELVEAGSPPGR